MQVLFFVLFLLLSFVSLYIPGYTTLTFLKVKFPKKEHFFYSWVLGIALFLFGTYLLSYVHLDFIYLFVIGFGTLWYLIKKQYGSLQFDIDKGSLVIILIGTVAFISVTMLSGISVPGGLQYVGIGNADGIVHIAHIKDQVVHFPPTHPGIAGVPLRGYHYFYDFLLSKFVKFYHFSADDLYFRFFPAIISFLYGLSFLILISRLTKKLSAQRIVLFFAYFGQSFSFLLSILHISPDPMSGGGLIQPLQLPFDPSVIVSLTFLLGAFALVSKIGESWKYALLVGFIIGVMCQIKVYAGITACGSLGLYSLYFFIKYKQKNVGNMVLALSTAVLGTVITFFPNNFGAGTLIFTPFRIYSHYMEQPIFDALHWEVRRQVFSARHNIARIIILYVEALGIFWGINLGWRLLLLFKAKIVFTKKFWSDDYAFLLSVAIIIPLLIGSFFIQSISVFDIIQFFWVGYALLSLPMGILLTSLFKSKRLFRFSLVVILLTAIPGIWAIENITVLHPQQALIPDKTLQFYRVVAKTVPPDKFVIVLPSEGTGVEKYVWSNTPLTEALSGRSAYVEGEIINYNLPVLVQRKMQVLNLLAAVTSCNRAMVKIMTQKIGSPYIIGDKDYSCLSDPLAKQVTTALPLRFYRIE